MLTAATRLPAAVAPKSAVFDGRRIPIGKAGCALLGAVASGGGCVSIDAAKEAMFGDPAATLNRLQVSLHRLNKKLADLGCGVRLSVDGLDVITV